MNTVAFILDHVKKLLESNSVYELRNAKSLMSDRFKKSSRITQTKLYAYRTVTKTVKREILVKLDVPVAIRNAAALRQMCLS